jgi:hypothetical protein
MHVAAGKPRYPFELTRRDPRLSLLAEERDRVGDELAGPGHALDLLR